MAAKWTKPRDELINIGVNLARTGYEPPHIAESMVMYHFQGTDTQGAKRRLSRAISIRFWKRYGARTEKQETLDTMVRTLHAEGWVPMFADDLKRCFWRHETTGQSVNSNGGYFYCYEAATRRAYESQTRRYLLEG